MSDWLTLYGEAAKTAVGFFWKAGWAFVMGYTISAMIQAFVPKQKLTQAMGDVSAKSVALATGFGSLSSSCSFAALAAARTLVQKGAHFIVAVAFMFASTNLVIELGILILIFLGWQFLVAEIIGGLILIAISSILIKLTYPKSWMQAAREKVEEEQDSEEDDFDWKQRIKSRDGWNRVGQNFVMEWGMVWQEILIGFTIAGFIGVFVPASFYETIFMAEAAAKNPDNFWIALENVAVAPILAGFTFIGSMGNIPLATVLNNNGVLFAGIMGFIYSDLMVPPLVKVNAKYYGWRVALYIAGIMYISIVITALLLHYGFLWADWMPESAKKVEDVTQFKIDYTFYLNLAAASLVSTMLWLKRRKQKDEANEEEGGGHEHDHESSKSFQDYVTYTCIALIVGGMCVWFTVG